MSEQKQETKKERVERESFILRADPYHQRLRRASLALHSLVDDEQFATFVKESDFPGDDVEVEALRTVQRLLNHALLSNRFILLEGEASKATQEVPS